MNHLWAQLMEVLKDPVEAGTARASVQLLMCHAGLQLFHDPTNGLELLKVKLESRNCIIITNP